MRTKNGVNDTKALKKYFCSWGHEKILGDYMTPLVHD